MSDKPNVHYGDINPIIDDIYKRKFNPKEDSFTESLRTLLLDSYKKKSILDKDGHYVGYVLRVNPLPKKTNLELSVSSDPINQNHPLLSCVIRIPELHAAIPEPKDYGTSQGLHQGIIDFHQTFVAASKDVSDKGVSIGDWVYCDFKSRKTLEDPIFFGRITDVPSPGQLSGQEDNKKELFQPGGELQTNPQETASKPSDSTPPSRFEEGFRAGKSLGMIEVKPFPREYCTQPDIIVAVEHYDNLIELFRKAESRLGKGVLRMTSGFRTAAKQAEIIKKLPQYAAKQNRSPHQSGVAYDFDVRKSNTSSQWTFLAQEGPKIGLVNVGRFFQQPREVWHWEFISPGYNSSQIVKCKNDYLKTPEEMRRDYLG